MRQFRPSSSAPRYVIQRCGTRECCRRNSNRLRRQDWSQDMTTFITASRLACLATVLAAGIASIPFADIANAKNNSSNGGTANGASTHFVITGQPANVKKVRSGHKDDRRDRKDRKHAKKH